MEQEETVAHILLHCSGVVNNKAKYLGVNPKAREDAKTPREAEMA